MEDGNQSAQNLTKALLSVDPKVTLNIANSIWNKDNFAVENDFIERNQTFYNAVVKPVDFNSSQTVNKINNWVDDKTNGKINKIIDQLSPLDRMILINAIYFKGEWRNQFKKEKTETDQFHLETWGTVDVPMMHTTGNYPYFENEILDALEMSYGRGNFSMVVLLPKEGYRVNDILDTLSAEVWKSWEDQFYVSNDVPVLFPKFKFKYESSLVKVLSTLGLSVAFDTDANFSGINKNTDLHISEVMHKTFIQVDEEGTEAAAVTSVTIGTTSVGPGMPFVADHPFVFMIKEKYTHAILFIGVMANPEIGN
jgi:serpin B